MMGEEFKHYSDAGAIEILCYPDKILNKTYTKFDLYRRLLNEKIVYTC